MIVIKDGTGTGYTAGVDAENALKITGPVLPHIAHESQKDQTAFFITTGGFIAFTNTASMNGLLYLKNTDSQRRTFHIERIRVCGGGAMNDHATMKVEIRCNDNAGTLITDEVAGSADNMYIGSANEFDGNVYTGGDSKTSTGGHFCTQFQCHINGESTNDYYSALILPKNASLSIMVQPSEACEICVEIIGYFESYEIV